MEPIKIPILWNTENSAMLEEMGINTNEYIINQVYFYNIDAVAEVTYHEGPNSLIYSSGVCFESTLTVKEVLDLINKKGA